MNGTSSCIISDESMLQTLTFERESGESESVSKGERESDRVEVTKWSHVFFLLRLSLHLPTKQPYSGDGL